MQIRLLVTPVDLEALGALAKGKRNIVHQDATFVLTAKTLAAGDAKGRTCCLACSNPASSASRQPEDGQEKYKLCRRSAQTYYCSKTCQVQHWRVHAKTCVPAAPKPQVLSRSPDLSP